MTAYELSRAQVVASFEKVTGEVAPADATTMDLFVWTREARLYGTTVEWFVIGDGERVDVVRTAAGDFVARHMRGVDVLGERAAYGQGEVGQRNATTAADQWAFGIRFDRRWMAGAS